MPAVTTIRDPLRRFTPTPLAANLPLMARTIRLETNSATVLGQTRRLLARYAGQAPVEPKFLWRIVSEADPTVTPPWPEVSAFSDHGLRYVSFGHRSFLAVDLEAREAVAFLAEGLARDQAGFSTPFLERLFLLTAGALGLTPVGAACLIKDGSALLVFGPPQSGKTTSCYLARRLGLEFVSDQATLLELADCRLRAWSEFWPTAFRPDALRFLPELGAVTRAFQYRDMPFLYLDKSPWASQTHRRAQHLTPSCCVFLGRNSIEAGAGPRLTRLAPAEFADRLDGCLLFKDDARFEAQQTSVLGALARLPAYRLSYGSDPGEAASFFPGLLDAHPLEGDS